MKLLLILSATALLLLPGAASAQQPPPGFDPAQMQEMMKHFQDPAAMQKLAEQAEAASRCMEGIDEAQLTALQKKAEQASRDIEQLCAAGKKDEALRKGLDLSRELKGNATVKKLRACSKGLSEAAEAMPWAQMPNMKSLTEESDPSRDDVCS